MSKTITVRNMTLTFSYIKNISPLYKRLIYGVYLTKSILESLTSVCFHVNFGKNIFKVEWKITKNLKT